MSNLTFGCFKQVYRGYGIYFQGGHLNVEGDGEYRSIAECKATIDRHVQLIEDAELQHKHRQIEAGAIRAIRDGDNVTIYFPDGIQTVSIRKYRQSVFEWEDQYNVEIVMFDRS